MVLRRSFRCDEAEQNTLVASFPAECHSDFSPGVPHTGSSLKYRHNNAGEPRCLFRWRTVGKRNLLSLSQFWWHGKNGMHKTGEWTLPRSLRKNGKKSPDSFAPHFEGLFSLHANIPHMANARWTVSSTARLNRPDATSKPSQAIFPTAHR